LRERGTTILETSSLFRADSGSFARVTTPDLVGPGVFALQ
jgi:hypothetical protein